MGKKYAQTKCDICGKDAICVKEKSKRATELHGVDKQYWICDDCAEVKHHAM